MNLAYMNSTLRAMGMAPLIFWYATAAQAETRFVSENGTHSPPFTNWTQAATNIAAALAFSIDDDTILVSNGTYYVSSQLQLTNGVDLLGVGGPDVTAIDGQGGTRCLYLSHSNALVEGFTIRHGYVNGAGGGGVLCETAGTMRNCLIAQNEDITTSGGGGGVFLNGGGVVDRCLIVSNQVESPGQGEDRMGGGGVACAFGGLVENSIVAYNTAHTGATGGGGGISCWGGGTVRGCAVFANTYYSGEGFGGGGICVMLNLQEANAVQIENCTVVRNAARGWLSDDQGYGGGFFSWGRATVINTIVYSNTAITAGDNYFLTGESADFRNCCIIPAPPFGSANLTNNPNLDSTVPYLLHAASPCINAGTNTPWVQDALDIDRQPRIFHDQVDIGADEASLIARAVTSPDGTGMIWEVIPDAVCQLRATTNLLDPTWFDMGARFTNDTNEIILSDTHSPDAHRFYQLLWSRP